MYGYEWTEENGIFRLTINAKIQKEIRPVFHEELDFFGMDQYWDYPKDTTAPLLWAEGVRRYVLNGVCVAEAQGGGFYTKPTSGAKSSPIYPDTVRALSSVRVLVCLCIFGRQGLSGFARPDDKSSCSKGLLCCVQ